MIKPKSLTEADLSGKTVLVRGDFDVDDGDNPRANSIRELVGWLISKNTTTIRVIGHSETNYDLAGQLKSEFPSVGFDAGLRKDAREKENNTGFAEELADGWDVYVNEAFATSHRKHTSIVMLPQVFKRDNKEVFLGFRFEKELEMLDKITVIVNSNRKSALVIGGVKIDDKQKFAEDMGGKFTHVLKGGLLPGVDLRSDGLDISDAAREEYCRIISEAEVILAAGVMGKYEDPSAAAGTKAVLEAIANNTNAYKVAGGGDIEMAISTFGLTDKFDWISVGGGAMLVYLSTGTLPGLEAIVR
jgi:phosphoglycerate kinase